MFFWGFSWACTFQIQIWFENSRVCPDVPWRNVACLRRLFVDFVLENPIFHFRKTRTMKEGINFKANVDMRRSPGAPGVQVRLRRSSMGFRDEEAGSPRGIPWGENVLSFT